MIEVINLQKSFAEVKAVKDVSFCAPDGLITGLLGPNGAGKSTTMRLISGVLEPASGQAIIDGFDSRNQTMEVQKRLGVLPDKRGLYQRLTARENVRYYGQLRNIPKPALESRIDDLFQMLDMASIDNRRVDGFSTGEKMKVALARALVHNPPNVILDEPTTGLDVMSTRAMRDVIRRLRDAGHCILFSSHVMQEVALLCENIVIIADGRVVAQGSPDDLRQATGQASLEDAFMQAIGTTEGLK